MSNGENSIPVGIWTKVSEYTSTYDYDEAGQLIFASDTKTNRAYGYIYNASGNMRRQEVYDISTEEWAEIGSTSYTYGANGALLSTRVTGTGTAPVNTTYQEDSMGNPISKTVGTTTSTYTWGEGRMLTGITTGSKSTVYTYNADGLRTSKTVTTGTATSTTEYIWGSNGLAGISQGLRKLLLLYDAEGSPIGFIMNGSAYTYVKNLQGDIIKILDNLGNAVVSYTYDPWGVPTATGDSVIASINPCTYRGYDYDEDTGYFYLQSRYYDPSAGRFICPDDPTTLFLSTQINDGFNLFSYCTNTPVNDSDPSGRMSLSEVVANVKKLVSKITKHFEKYLKSLFVYNRSKQTFSVNTDVISVGIDTIISAVINATIYKAITATLKALLKNASIRKQFIETMFKFFLYQKGGQIALKTLIWIGYKISGKKGTVETLVNGVFSGFISSALSQKSKILSKGYRLISALSSVGGMLGLMFDLIDGKWNGYATAKIVLII